jgi:hypothetical protein
MICSATVTPKAGCSVPDRKFNLAYRSQSSEPDAVAGMRSRSVIALAVLVAVASAGACGREGGAPSHLTNPPRQSR